MTLMTIEVAKAHANERMAHAQKKRQEREAASIYRANRISSLDHRILAAVGNRLIHIGESLSRTTTPGASAIRDIG